MYTSQQSATRLLPAPPRGYCQAATIEVKAQTTKDRTSRLTSNMRSSAKTSPCPLRTAIIGGLLGLLPLGLGLLLISP